MWRRKKKCERRLKKHFLSAEQPVARGEKGGWGGNRVSRTVTVWGFVIIGLLMVESLTHAHRHTKHSLTLEEKQNKKSAASISHLLHHAEINDHD